MAGLQPSYHPHGFTDAIARDQNPSLSGWFFRGWNPTQLYRDSFMSHCKDPSSPTRIQWKCLIRVLNDAPLAIFVQRIHVLVWSSKASTNHIPFSVLVATQYHQTNMSPCKSKTSKIMVPWKCWSYICTKIRRSFRFKTIKFMAGLDFQGISHTIHVWYMYLHLLDFYGKFSYIYLIFMVYLYLPTFTWFLKVYLFTVHLNWFWWFIYLHLVDFYGIFTYI